MRTRKIRGHNRRHLNIENWRLENLEIRLDLIERYTYDYAKIIVHPWCDISIINSKIPEPKRKTKQLMLNGLFDIYESWKKQLDKLNQPYYLKIWLFEPLFSQSQVVCAIGERINYYENLFAKPNQSKRLNNNNSIEIKRKLNTLKWKYALDESLFDADDLGESKEDKIWFNKALKKPYRTTIIDNKELYLFKEGDVWLGGLEDQS